MRRHRGGTSFALAAPIDQLFVATELNEWALAASLCVREPGRRTALESAMVIAAREATPPPALPPVLDEPAALDRLVKLAALESRPLLRAGIARASSLGLGWLLDDEGFSMGEGAGHAGFALGALPRPGIVHWESLRNVPVALVTGSNGKTTTVRLLAACARAHGLRTGHNCTDGVFLDDRLLVSGDYAGPLGARTVLRDARVQAAVIEAARGGLLRRGSAVNRADVAVVTNVSLDHMGAYGIDDLEGMAAVKLIVANLVGPRGLVVLNADDPMLARHARNVEAPVGWFALDAETGLIEEARAGGAPTCAVRAGRLGCTFEGVEHDFGAIDAMPLTSGGRAAYNVANLAAAALAALALGLPPAVVREVFARFGSSPADNAGRLMRFEVGGLQVIVDYAHNPEGLHGVLAVARSLLADGRLLLLLGQAGDRGDADIAELAAVAARARPDIVAIKEMEGHLRGRAPGEVPALLRRGLLAQGLATGQLLERGAEIDAARALLSLARARDVVLLPVHGQLARSEIVSLIGRMRGDGWQAGERLPA
ncbi:MAG: Mur ligase family protein [Steroidobacteraceae bacterium]